MTIVAAEENMLRLLAWEEIASEISASTGIGCIGLRCEVVGAPATIGRPPEFVNMTIVAAEENVLRLLAWEEIASEISASTGIGCIGLRGEVVGAPATIRRPPEFVNMTIIAAKENVFRLLTW